MDVAAWRCDNCGYVHPAPATPERCPDCDVGPLGSWTGADLPAPDLCDCLVPWLDGVGQHSPGCAAVRAAS